MRCRRAEEHQRALATYDVLFLNNATLRMIARDPGDSASRAAVKWPTTGLANAVAREQQEAIASFVRDGKGLVVVHPGVDAFYGWPEYPDIVGGGLFLSHPFTRLVLGHFADTWKRDDYFTSILQGIRIAAGRLPADFSASSR